MVFVEEFLGSIGVDQQAIDAIMAMLDESADSLGQSSPGELRRGALGGSETAQALADDTALAHQHVVAAITEMATGMKGFRINVATWQSDMTFTDEDAGASISRLQADGATQAALARAIRSASACTTSPDFRTTPAESGCDVPDVAVTGGAG